MDLRNFISDLEKVNEIKKIDKADWNLEIGVLTELGDERNLPALLFDNIQGYPAGYRVVTNLVATPKRLAMAFGLPAGISNVEMVRQLKEKFKSLKSIPPAAVKSGPLLENIQRDDEVNLLKFPVPFYHENDGGRYMGTADMVIMRDPAGNWVNMGTYRIQLHDKNTLGLYISPGHHGRLIRENYWAQGKACPVAVVFGAHPLVWVPSTLAMPWGVEEMGLVGGLLGKPLEVITGEYTGLPIPSYGEIAIEGECPPPSVESRKEGPFGEWPGYYGSGARTEPVIRVKRVMHRNNPILAGSPPLKPPASGSASFIARAANLWSEIEKLGIPGIKGVYQLRAGGSRYLTTVSIEQKYAGHARQVGMAVMSTPEGAYHGRFVIVVDEDIDPSNQDDVFWAVSTRCDPALDIEIIRDCWSTPLDPIMSPDKKAKGDFTNSRAIINACRPYHWRKEFPLVNRASNELRNKILSKWKNLFPEG